MMVDSGTPPRDISMTSALVSGCLPVCAKAVSASKRSGSARFMTEIVVELWVIRSHGDSQDGGNATAACCAMGDGFVGLGCDTSGSVTSDELVDLAGP